MGSTIKLIVNGESCSIDIYEKEPGKLVLQVYDNEEPNSCCCCIETDTKQFIENLQKLLGK